MKSTEIFSAQESMGSDMESVPSTNKDIKRLIKQVENVMDAEKNLSEKRRKLSKTLLQFKMDMVEKSDSIEVISGSFKEFGRFMNEVEDERERMFENASESFIKPLKRVMSDLAITTNRNKLIKSETFPMLVNVANEQLNKQNYTGHNLRIQDCKNLEFVEFIEVSSNMSMI